MSTERIVWGEAFDADLSATATGDSVAPDWAETDVTLVWDLVLPNGVRTASVRQVYRWRPAGTSDPEFSLDGDTLRFTILAADVAADLIAGNWKVYWCVGPVATTQDAVGSLTVHVEGPPYGTALPTSDPS